MSDYKRLTERRGNLIVDNCKNCENVSNPMGCTNNCCYEVMKKRLAELEDKIENGKLIELPCKVGDTVYLLDNDEIDIISEGIVVDYKISVIDYSIFVKEGKYSLQYWKAQLGFEWFLTKAEAEKKLQELRGKDEKENHSR